MTKIYVPLPTKKYIQYYLENNVNGFLLGIENFSINFNNYLKLDELEVAINYLKDNNKEVYISLNKLYYEKNIKDLTNLLNIISKYNIDGVMFCDVSVYEIVKENNLKINLIWDSYHLGTNYETINFWNKRNVKKAILSTEITLDEIIEINNIAESKVGITLYGYLNMVTSSRSLITNYFKHLNKNNNDNQYLMDINDLKYPIVEENDETNIFSSKVLNGLKYFPKIIENDIDFIILNDYLIEPLRFYNIIEAFAALRNAPNDEEFVKKLEKVVEVNTYEDTFHGFLDKKTIYKVK